MFTSAISAAVHMGLRAEESGLGYWGSRGQHDHLLSLPGLDGEVLGRGQQAAVGQEDQDRELHLDCDLPQTGPAFYCKQLRKSG